MILIDYMQQNWYNCISNYWKQESFSQLSVWMVWFVQHSPAWWLLILSLHDSNSIYITLSIFYLQILWGRNPRQEGHRAATRRCASFPLGTLQYGQLKELAILVLPQGPGIVYICNCLHLLDKSNMWILLRWGPLMRVIRSMTGA